MQIIAIGASKVKIPSFHFLIIRSKDATRLLGAPGLTTRSKKLLVTKGIATRSKDAVLGSHRCHRDFPEAIVVALIRQAGLPGLLEIWLLFQLCDSKLVGLILKLANISFLAVSSTQILSVSRLVRLR